MQSKIGAVVGGTGGAIGGAKLGAILGSPLGPVGSLIGAGIGGLLGGTHGAEHGSKNPEQAVALGVISAVLPGAGMLDEAVRAADVIPVESISNASAHLYTNT